MQIQCSSYKAIASTELLYTETVLNKVNTSACVNTKVKPWSQGWLIAAGAYPGFCSMKRLKVFLLPLDGMLVHRRSLPRNFVRFPQQIAGTHLCTWVERGTVRVFSVLPKNTTHCLRPGLESGPLTPELSALIMRPPCLPPTTMCKY